MTTKQDGQLDNMERLNANLARVDELSRRLMHVMSHKKQVHPGLAAPNQELWAKAAASYWSEMLQDPARVLEHQVQYWGETMKHFVAAQHVLAQGKFSAPEDTGPSDRRFAHPLWDTNPYFNFIKQQYQINARALDQAVEDAEGLSPLEQRRLRYFTRQISDMMAPTNYLGTNPEALEKAVETEGQSLVDGLERLVADLEANEGELVVKLADDTAFELGENIATAPGKVVYRNRMMELIQYQPTTEKVHETPLIIFPPWINKFYIMDLKKENSLIRWITEQGYTLFVVSWVNPDHDYADVGLEEYIEEGYVAAIREVKDICRVRQVNVVGYCIAGTTLSMALAHMKAHGDKSIKSATFFTALTDFSDQGEFTPFLTDDFVDALEEQARKSGVLESYIMARTFSFLRANDLVYGPAIRSYMMGQTPPAFDLLYWNGDGSNLPAKMAVQYLRRLCQGNDLAEGRMTLFDGEPLQLKDVDVPLFAVTCETDHIAAWKDCYRGVQKMGAKDKTFIVSQSGHIAGIVNPPSRNKYGHYTNDDLTLDHGDWMAQAEFHGESWWPRWETWLAKRSGKMIEARMPGDNSHPPLAEAPGTYVRVKAEV
ncbi:PHA/PHB synthase family protein [Mesobacterium pallidum]|uniref:PHA/PHB synthase family protein n=1 Tax=Mesobacterium pallidum TaxID=2872037 RepID=UPI001EE21285|nr:class I poly(R)-hydroxyalkanoic acid synthase [Mesobacterium pallidum]